MKESSASVPRPEGGPPTNPWRVAYRVIQVVVAAVVIAVHAGGIHFVVNHWLCKHTDHTFADHVVYLGTSYCFAKAACLCSGCS